MSTGRGWWIAVALAAAAWIEAGRLVTAADAQAAAVRQPAPASSPEAALIAKYCVTCHNDRLKTAGLSLERRDFGRIADEADVWEKVVRKVRTQAMPPAGMPRPDAAGYRALASFLERTLDRAAEAHPNPGRPGLHRLNRTEYVNAIRDLLALDVDGRSLLPADESGYGFDNNAEVLSLSSSLLDRYLSAARVISRLAVADPAMRPVLASFRAPRYLMQDERMSEDMGFGTRGGFAVHHDFPLDALYDVKVRLQANDNETLRGLAQSNEIELRLDGALIKRFSVGGPYRRNEGGTNEPMDVRVPVKAGPHVITAAFLDRSSIDEGVLAPRVSPTSFAYASANGDRPVVGTIQIGGPYEPSGPGDTPSRRRIFTCRPSSPRAEEPCAREILSTLARRGYRRPVTTQDVDLLMTAYDGVRATKDFDAGVRAAIERVLVNPDFLFRIERDPAGITAGGVYRITDLELASRLSFFLWSSIPDDELLEAARKGTLKDPAVLGRQVRRMLTDERVSLVTNFASQWLYLRNLKLVTPDPTEFPEFDDNLRQAFEEETKLFIQSQLREDRGLPDLLSANYTFLNERLARHYGIPSVYGSHFRRVTLSDERRFGLLGKASVLTVTSYANRTSPTLRGKFLLDNILGAPMPPPPPNVPALGDANAGDRLLSVRERLEQHRRNPICATCHARMDPLGFALEHYDAVGRWRTLNEANAPIDASGALPEGTKFQGASELRQYLLDQRDEFALAVTEKLLTYALGRGVDSFDQPALRKIVREAGPDYRWSSILLGIIKSTPFQMRRSES
jgi:hypothetical protein